MTTIGVKNLVGRAGAASVWRVLGVYVLISWAILEAIDLLIARFGLPGWFFPMALGLLAVGLPVVLATALYQARRAASGGQTPAGAGADPRDPRFRRLLTWRTAILSGLLAFLTLGTIGATVVWLRISGSELRPNVVAVMPFHVVGEDVELWREGMVDLLATALDATGQFHSSDPRAVLNRFHRLAENPGELPEPEIAAEVAAQLGASRVILGSLIKTGPNAVRLSADIYSVRWLREEASAVVTGSEDDITSLVEQLTIELLRNAWQGEDMPEVRMSALTTASIPALRAYLEGEQAFRHSQFTEAQDALDRAIEHDSTFAIAHYRLAHAYGWSFGLGANQVPFHLAAAERHSQGLPARDSLLIRAWKLADVDGSLEAIPLFQNLTARYPDDLEAWHGLGDALFHLGSQAGRPISDAQEALERTLELDPSFAPALIHLIELTYQQNDSLRGRDWTLRYLALDSTSNYARAFSLLTALQFGPPGDSARAAAVLDTASSDQIYWTLARLRGVAAPLPLYEMVALRAADPRFSEVARHMAFWFLGLRYLRHGQVEIAVDLLQQSMALADGAMDVAALNLLANARDFGIALDPTSEEIVERLAAEHPGYVPTLAVKAVREGRDEQAAALVARFEARADSLLANGDSAAARSVRGRALTLKGRVSAARDSVDVAVEQLRRGLDMINAVWYGYRDIDRYWLAQLLEQQGGEEEAIRIYGSLYSNVWLEPLGYYQRALLHERRGEMDEAVRYYARFVELWGDADEQLQSRVENARRALERLRGERMTG
ncbi:MAG: tetratricopeptide repeat protein [Gemmatimonadota bacterium]|nr:MAG: tetratricopeptide repeat protein [Gemmatimonadota bacterium]